MIVKGFQLLGVLFPIVVIVTADYFLKDVTPATYLLWCSIFYGGAGCHGNGFYGVFCYCHSYIFHSFKRENRDYFKFQNIGWKSVMFLNWAIILFCCVFVAFQ